MTDVRRCRRPVLAIVTALLAGLVLAGCVSLPEQGPVVESRVSTGVNSERASDIDPLPPASGASPPEIARGFLDAMTASPIETSVARQFLAESSAQEWNPEAQTITYATKQPPSDGLSAVTVALTGAERLSGAGTWQGRVPEDEQTLRFQMIQEDGEYRIVNPPDALVVPASWFEQRFRQVSLYFFDRTARILVPEPVFVPRGEQFATALIDGLLAGPSVELGQVSRSFIPDGVSVGLSVPISEDGVADVSLLGDVSEQSPEEVERMLAQLAWTLRQEPQIESIRVSIGGEEVSLPGGVSAYDVNDADQYDPTGFQATSRLYGLRDGLLVAGEDTEISETDGPLGSERYGVRSVAVNLDSTQAATVSQDGTTAYTAPVRDSSEEGEPAAPVESVLSAGTDVLQPAWDFTERIWFVDRSADGARVSYFERGELRSLVVRGVTGRRVKSFLVSRDATRFVAVVRGREVDELRVGRIRVNDRGTITGAVATERVSPEAVEPLRIQDIAWSTPTSIIMLSAVVPSELYEVDTVAVDGAPIEGEALGTTINGRVVGLAGTPVPERDKFAVTPDGLVDLATGTSDPFPDDRTMTSFDFVG